MAKMVISLVIDADRDTTRKIKSRCVLAAHKHLVSCSIVTDAPVDPESRRRIEWQKMLQEIDAK